MAELPLMVALKVTKDPDTGCWIWTGNISDKGYGRYAGRTVHRIVYEALVGGLDPRKELHHRCENPPCCNPEHLQQLTRVEHHKASQASNGNKTSCPKGHEYTVENTRIEKRSDGGNARRCLTCERARGAARRVLPLGESNYDRHYANKCKRGHSLEGAWTDKYGSRKCRECGRLNAVAR
jgi:hypothetical protein